MHFQWNDKLQSCSAHKFLASTKYIIALVIYINCSVLWANDQLLLNKIRTLESNFNDISEKFYSDRANTASTSPNSFSDINQLSRQINKLSSLYRYSEAIQLIFNNLQIVEDNLDHPAILKFMELLLERNAINLANKLYKTIKLDGDDFQLATTEYLYADYHATRFEWLKVKQRLEKVLSDLSEENADYASLLMGTALQHLKQHRKAGDNYRKIPSDSKYYQHAQLNLALTQLRQGWLTNARSTINELMLEKQNNIDHEFTNRLYLVLGYALLQKNYFRSSRDVFRKISQNSQYANRALLGIALCSINQDDLQSGLNTLFLLKNKKVRELSVDEAYLLITYVYEKFEQKTDVVASSTEAINYYQIQIKKLQAISIYPINFDQLNFDENDPVFKFQNFNFEYARKFPKSFLINYRQLLDFAKLNSHSNLAKKIEQLISKFDAVFQLIIQSMIQQKLSYLNSYMNQARFGLARLYDSDAHQP